MSETKTAEEAIELIKGRIMDEYRKHQTLDWSNIAARKIHSQWFEYYNQQNQELQRQIQQLKEDASYINGTMGDMLGEHKELNEGLQRQVEELTMQNEMFKRSIESWKKEELINNEHVSELQALLEEKSAENDRLFNKYTQLKDSADEMAKNLKECKDGVDVLQGEYQDGWGDTINDANKALETYKHLTNKP